MMDDPMTYKYALPANGPWLPIQGWPKYLINAEGQVYGLHHKKILSPFSNHRGYKIIELWNKKEHQKYTVHRLVLNTFVGPSTMPINHINGVREDNRLCNLHYTTHRENVLDAHRRGNPGNTRLLPDEVREIYRRVINNESGLGLAKEFGVDPSTISRIKKISGKYYALCLSLPRPLEIPRC